MTWNKKIGIFGDQKSGAGFTLVEIMISIAITAILSTMFFSGLAQEKNRSALKQAADQLQVDLQGMQNLTQTGVVAPGTSTPPAGNGIFVETATKGRYILFADIATGAPPVGDSQYIGSDVIIQTRTLSNQVEVYRLQTNLGSANRLDIVFAGFRGDATISPSSGCAVGNPACATSATITLRNTRLNVCYDITVQKSGGIVTKRQLSSTCA